MKIAVVGTGAMGSIYAARLAAAGHDVWAVDTWETHVNAIRTNGLRVDGPDGELHTTSLKATRDFAEVETCDLYIIATKASGVAASAKAIASMLHAEAMVLTIQNGLGAAEQIAHHLPTNQVMLGVAEGFGASMVGPGRAQHTSMKQIRLGMMNGGRDTRLETIADIWRSGGFTIETFEDIEQLIWEKLLCNVTLSGPCTVFGCNVADLRAKPDRWGVAIGCMQEAHAAGVAKGVNFTFTDPIAYVTAFAEQVGTAKPSMLQDHEAGRASELDAINGAIPRVARQYGIPAPYNETVSAVIRARESHFRGAGK